jgi:uncharacterized membrane protein YeaQ/YmgE (transglycosylase-associated protein family)
MRLIRSGGLSAARTTPSPVLNPRKQQKERVMHMPILWWIIVGLVAGWLTGKIMKGSGYGFFVDIIVGIAGALVGGFIARHLGLGVHYGMIATILVATGGAIVLVFLLRLISGNR